MQVAKKIIIFFLFMFFFFECTIVQAQFVIMNIEQFRLKEHKEGLTGDIRMSISSVRLSSHILNVNSGSHIYYKHEDYSWLVLGKVGIVRADSNSITSSASGHIRYDRKWLENHQIEAFTQWQYNKLAKLNLRWVSGFGPRFKLTPYEDARFRFYFAALYMFEHESLIDEDFYHRDHRLSSYFSFALKPYDDVSFISTTYFQPRLDYWDDFRLSNENVLALKVSENLKLELQFVLAYDKFPAEGVPGLSYELQNTMTYRFLNKPKSVKDVERSKIAFLY